MVAPKEPNWSRAEVDTLIASGQRHNIRLQKKVPVAWIYLTAWMSRDQIVHFRKVDAHPEAERADAALVAFHQLIERAQVAAAQPGGQVLVSGRLSHGLRHARVSLQVCHGALYSHGGPNIPERSEIIRYAALRGPRAGGASAG